MTITIYHNPACGTSRTTLQLIQQAGVTPTIIEYLKTPPSREVLTDLLQQMNLPIRAILRTNVPPYHDLGLENLDLRDDQLMDAVMAHPILIQRPIVVSQKGVRLCRPPQTVEEIL